MRSPHAGGFQPGEGEVTRGGPRLDVDEESLAAVDDLVVFVVACGVEGLDGPPSRA
jgi:hypothetical protein